MSCFRPSAVTARLSLHCVLSCVRQAVNRADQVVAALRPHLLPDRPQPGRCCRRHCVGFAPRPVLSRRYLLLDRGLRATSAIRRNHEDAATDRGAIRPVAVYASSSSAAWLSPSMSSGLVEVPGPVASSLSIVSRSLSTVTYISSTPAFTLSAVGRGLESSSGRNRAPSVRSSSAHRRQPVPPAHRLPGEVRRRASGLFRGTRPR